MKVASAATGLSHPGMKDNLSKDERGTSGRSQQTNRSAGSVK